MLITYTVIDRGFLFDTHVASETRYIAHAVENDERRFSFKGTRDETLSGAVESWLDSMQQGYVIDSGLVLPSQVGRWREFFSSVINGETFQIDFTAAKYQLTNHSFESGDLTGWATSGTPSASTAQAHEGTYSVQLPGNSVLNLVTQDIPASEGDSFFSRQWARSVSADANSAFGNEWVGPGTFATINGDFSVSGWQEFEQTVTAPATTTAMRLRAASPASVTTGNWYGDNFEVWTLGTNVSCWLASRNIREQRIGNAGYQFSFEVRVNP